MKTNWDDPCWDVGENFDNTLALQRFGCTVQYHTACVPNTL